jgi:hypothetical protein
MNSQATSVARLRTHRSAIVACFVFLREISRKALWDFCNTIGTKRTWQPSSAMSAIEGKADLALTNANVGF